MTFQEGGVESQTVSLKSIVSEGFGEYTPWQGEHAVEQAAARPRTRRRESRPAPEEYDEEEDEEPEEEVPAKPRSRAGKRKPARASAKKRETEEDEGEEEEEAPQDLVGRRCLFHGGIAVKRCGKCKAVLCKECIRGSDKCPRCNAPLKGGRAPKPSEEEGPEEEEDGEEPAPTPRKKRPRRKSDESAKLEDLSRL